MSTIPVVSMKDFHANTDRDRRKRFVKEFGDALRTYGFARLVDHEVRAAWIDSMQVSARKLFARPAAELMAYHRPEINRQRGYVPYRLETAAGYDVPDEKACWHYGRHSVSPNVMPPDELVPSFRLDCARLYDVLDRIYVDLMLAVELYLDLPDSVLVRAVRGQNNSLLRVAFYPKFRGDEPPGALRSKEHKDINMLTLLPTATASGLQVQARDGTWIPIKSIPGEIVVNSALMLERVTNGYIAATPHRVVNPNTNGIPNDDRVSLPFFGHPVGTAMLEVPSKFVGEGFPEPKPAVTANEALIEVLREIKLLA